MKAWYEHEKGDVWNPAMPHVNGHFPKPSQEPAAVSAAAALAAVQSNTFGYREHLILAGLLRPASEDRL